MTAPERAMVRCLFFFVASMALETSAILVPRPTYDVEGGGRVVSDVPPGPRIFPKEEWRLPGHMRPVGYNVRLLPLIEEGSFLTEGFVEIIADCLNSAGNITLHSAVDIDDSSVAIFRIDTNEAQSVTSITKDLEYQLAIVDTAVTQGGRYKISMSFSYTLSATVLKGLYLSSYVENGVKKYLAVTQFETAYARRAFPCFDEPELKAVFNIILGRKSSWTSASNTPVAQTIPIVDLPGYVWDIYQSSPVMSSYLVAFLISEYNYVESDPAVSNTTFRIWARPDYMDYTPFALEVAPRITNFFESYFGVKYVLPKQDNVAVPDFTFGAMENWGLITYRESALLYNPAVDTVRSKQSVCDIIAHELAHQWVGNLVTCKWWSVNWLNEGFASLIQNYGSEAVQPQFGVFETFTVDVVQSVMMSDSVPFRAMNYPPTFSQVESLATFDAIAYDKGASVLRMMEDFLGAETFRKGMNRYLTRMAYNSAEPDDVYAAHDEQAALDGVTLPVSLKTIMDTWTYQMGFPLVTVTRNYADGRATVAQERFLRVADDDETVYKWWVPLTYRTASSSAPSAVWINETLTTGVDFGASSTDWLLANVDQKGYYRVMYDPENYGLLSDQLVADHNRISTFNRAQLLDDAFNLALLARINYTIALDLTLYLANEKNYSPWTGFLPELEYVHFQLIGTEASNDWQRYLSGLVTPYFNYIGFVENADDEHLIILGRTNAIKWACRLGDTGCARNATIQFADWMSSPAEIEVISRHQKSTILCAGIEYGTEEDWDYAFNRFLNTQVASERSAILSSLGCTKMPAIHTRIFDVILNPPVGVSTNDGVAMFNALANNPTANEAAFEFLRTQWDALFSSYSNYMPGFVRTVSARYNTRVQQSKLEDLVTEHSDVLGNSNTVIQALSTVQSNIYWMERNFAAIANWLKLH